MDLGVGMWRKSWVREDGFGVWKNNCWRISRQSILLLQIVKKNSAEITDVSTDNILNS